MVAFVVLLSGEEVLVIEGWMRYSWWRVWRRESMDWRVLWCSGLRCCGSERSKTEPVVWQSRSRSSREQPAEGTIWTAEGTKSQLCEVEWGMDQTYHVAHG